MPLYITDVDFFSDAGGIGKGKGSIFVETEKEHRLTLTYSAVPTDKVEKISAFFLLNDDQKDYEGTRFSSIFTSLLRHDCAVFHFQIGSEDMVDFYDAFLAEKKQILARYPQIDTEKLFIGGFGHGVSSMLYITGHSNDFSAAVSINGFVNYTTAYGNYENYQHDFHKSQTPDFQTWLYQMADGCPLQYLDENNTPYLILHAHRDYICPEEQSEELFSGIKDRIPEVPCRMVIFPEENHNILLPGHETYRERIAQEILRWFHFI